MTKKQRAQVVELLRCAADSNGPGVNGMFCMDAPKDIDDLAWGARGCMPGSLLYGGTEQYRTALLNAAILVEEGSWP